VRPEKKGGKGLTKKQNSTEVVGRTARRQFDAIKRRRMWNWEKKGLSTIIQKGEVLEPESSMKQENAPVELIILETITMARRGKNCARGAAGKGGDVWCRGKFSMGKK